MFEKILNGDETLKSELLLELQEISAQALALTLIICCYWFSGENVLGRRKAKGKRPGGGNVRVENVRGLQAQGRNVRLPS